MRRNKEKKLKLKVKKEKLFNLAIGVLGVALCSVITLGLAKENKVSALNEEEYNKWLMLREDAINTSAKKEELNIYEKFKEGEAVNILILGDKIGKSEGIGDESKSWHNKLEKWISDTYKSKVNLTNLSGGNTSIHKGLADFAKCKEKNYDVVIICYGEEDNLTNNDEFPYAYEALIKEIKDSKKNVEIIPIIENSLYEGCNEIEDIKLLGDHYKLPLVNVRERFLNSGRGYQQLLNEDGTLPNEDGYDIYFNAIKDEIVKNIENNSKVNEDIRLLHGGTKKFID